MAKAYGEMERKLLYVIIHPAMLATILFGILLVSQNPPVLQATWFYVKMALVLLLIVYQVFAGMTQKRFARGDYFLSERACRIINEVPTLILIAVVILAEIKPWS
jgi:putative membrane protein